MKTKKRIMLKALIAWAYLFIALILVFLITLATPATRELNIISQTENMPGILLLLAALIYMIHFVYGGILYPDKYLGLLNSYDRQVKNEYDFSDFRGLFATMLVVCALILGHFSFSFWYVYVVWIILNVLLTYFTRTDNLFKEDSVIIDEPKIMLWKKPDASGHLFTQINYLSPTLGDDINWSEKIITIYIGEQAKIWEEINSERDKRVKIDQ